MLTCIIFLPISLNLTFFLHFAGCCYLQSWELALFAPSAFFLVTGAVVYSLFCRNEPVDFDRCDNSPFAWEKMLARLPFLNREKQV
jgi:hypothetical protein